jgi:hypothetical protein
MNLIWNVDDDIYRTRLRWGDDMAEMKKPFHGYSYLEHQFIFCYHNTK